MAAIVTRGDAANLHMPDETVDLVVTSPPYFGLRSYQDGGEHYEGQVGDEATPTEYLDALIACTAEWVRVLKPGGSIFVNLGDKYSQRVAMRTSSHQDGLFPDRPELAKDWKASKARGEARMPYQNVIDAESGAYVREKSLIGLPWRYAIRCIDELGLILRAEVIWSKPNGLPESVTDRVRRSHEQVFHLVKQPRYFSAVDEVREPHLNTGGGRGNYIKSADAAALGAGMPRHTSLSSTDGNPLGKLPGSVWEIPTAPLKVPASLGLDHFAAYPPELVRRIVLGWSPDGGTVLDPFGGTGTTALVASCYGRVGISVDLSADYCRLARWRTTDLGERARVLKVDKPPVQVDGQLGMFEGIA